MSLQSLSHFQSSIDATKTVLQRLQVYWPEEVVLGSGEAQMSSVDYFPYLFLSAFPSLKPADIEPLSLSGLLLAHSSFLYDKVMDRTSDAYLGTVSALRLQAMQLETYHQLYQLFPPSANFWNYFRKYLLEYADACLQEQRLASCNRPWQEYSEQVALEIAIGKNGLARIAIAGLVELAQDDSLAEPLVECINQFNEANQLWDDLCDWKQDLRHRIPSLPLLRLLPDWPPTKLNQEEETRLLQQLARKLYYGGHAHYILELALQSLDRSERIIEDIPGLLWSNVTSPLRHKCQALLQDINQIVHFNLQRSHQQSTLFLNLPSAKSSWQQMAWDGLNFMARQWQLGFGEVRHIMHLSQQEGFSNSQEYHYGDIFQRALITDALCDANELLNGQLQPWLDYEVNYLVNCRLNSGVGGWSYFPSVPEVAPDADDLGQVMQALLRSGHEAEVREYCEAPLSVLLTDNAKADGSFETWIVPAKNRTLEQERQVEFNQTRWGTGPDNEVMANLLYALTLYEPRLFAETIQQGVTYLEAQQESDGSWTSKWYYGPYYGTYVCLRLFAVARPDSPAIQSALNFLRRQQLTTGGWGLQQDSSDPLSTALALLGLAVVQENNNAPSDFDRAERALVYLQQSQAADRGWSSIQFIRPRMNEPYSSRTITSLYVLKAALIWHRLLAKLPVNREVNAVAI